MSRVVSVIIIIIIIIISSRIIIISIIIIIIISIIIITTTIIIIRGVVSEGALVFRDVVVQDVGSQNASFTPLTQISFRCEVTTPSAVEGP